MINRKVLYGYQIQNGALEIAPEEQRAVSMVFTLYNAGASYQAISDALNRQGIPYCREVPLWNKHKVKRLLENPRYTGKEGYPILVEADIFQAAQEKTAEKNVRRQSHGEKPAIARLTPYFRCTCGGKMTRLGGGWQNSGKLYLRCEGCGNTAVMDMDATVNGIVRQFRDHEQPSCTAYTPSAEVMRLDNAINRGLEQPDSPEAVMALILQGAAARYACCPEPSAESEPSDSLTEADWRRFQRAVSHITISQDTEVTLIFTDKNTIFTQQRGITMRYTMMQVCKETGMTYQALKFYCNEGLVPNVKRDKNNRRVFDERDVAWISSLTRLKKCGMSIQEMKDYLALCLQGERTIPQRKILLAQKQEALRAGIRELQDSVAYIDWKQNFYDEVLSGKRPYESNLIRVEK